jgi:myosin heavy subunit
LFLENLRLRKNVEEIKRQKNESDHIHQVEMNKAAKEIEKLKAELEWLAGVNNDFGIENEKLHAEIDRIKRYRVPASARSSPESELEVVEAESSLSKRRRTPSRSRSRSRKSRRTDKGKSRMSETEEESSDSEDEINEKEARVCNLTKIRNAILDFFLSDDKIYYIYVYI